MHSDLEVVPIGGEHIQAIDEPIIAKVGEHEPRVRANQADRTSEMTMTVADQSSAPPPGKLAGCANAWSWPRPGGEKIAAKRDRRASGAPASTSWSIRVASRRSGALCHPVTPTLYRDGVVRTWRHQRPAGRRVLATNRVRRHRQGRSLYQRWPG